MIKYYLNAGLLCFFIMTSSLKNATFHKQSSAAKSTTSFSDTTLVWSDEFNTDGTPDPAKWGYDIGNGSDGWGNHELEYYTSRPENAIVKNGCLKLTARKENYNGQAYTSARLLSKDKFSFTYGKVNIRAKFPAAVGTWPALWLLGSNIGTVNWPACGEIDIAEQRGSELNKIYGTLHYPGLPGSGNGSTKMISDATTAFHKYTLDWFADSIKISVDDVPYFVTANNKRLPFDHDFFVIFNIAVGGEFGGNVDPAFTTDSMLIDYVRIYK
ncbi:glycoside hydrolase family 16 protein [Ginsengibacter hankyongi]|uniref:Glycoside hydrolase family 16 protein n=1 Tax=Ginsengibacter hankyongi TaxID=2607284 RepID=A0A5J5ICX4_9BACT|nr:glycoside hydrolase family 16 protein [Ginsengibacter hankyongi]KAA9037607.1 glycoside hydrolase family 16 protein [Ginsengibacter hankyongi]